MNPLRHAAVLMISGLLCGSGSMLSAQTVDVLWVSFTDKAGTPYTLSNPRDFLTQAAIDRRLRFGITTDSTDLPVNESYISNTATVSNGTPWLASRWLNGVLLQTADSSVAAQIRALPYVADCQWVTRFSNGWPYIKAQAPQVPGDVTPAQPVSMDATYYGGGWNQIHTCEGEFLHERGYEGQGMLIAVIDAGFSGLYNNSYFEHLVSEGRIADRYSFLRNDTFITQDGDHGLRVLSVMAGYRPDAFVGTAPKARYALYQTDHQNTESFVEVYAWIAALERADSIGADIVNNSLGYSIFDESVHNFTTATLDGHSNLLSRMANTGASKGMLIVSSAGNEGNRPWKHILFPSDGDSVLAVGNTDAGKHIHYTSGKGPAGLSKPDVVAMGTNARVINRISSIAPGNGASFATPVVSGLAACFWQLDRNRHPAEIRSLIRQYGHLGVNDSMQLYGYGVPDFKRMAQPYVSIKETAPAAAITVYPNPSPGTITVSASGERIIRYQVINMTGKVLLQETLVPGRTTAEPDVSNLAPGIYTLLVYTDKAVSSSLFTRL